MHLKFGVQTSNYFHTLIRVNFISDISIRSSLNTSSGRVDVYFKTKRVIYIRLIQNGPLTTI